MIVKGSLNNLKEITNLALKLWPNHSFDELLKEYQDILQNDNNVIFLYNIHNLYIGFIQCQLRFDYVEGTTSSPVAYIEGIYIEKEYRNKGFAKELVQMCQQWAKEKKY